MRNAAPRAAPTAGTYASYTTTCTGRPCSAARLRDEERVQRLGTRGREPLEVGPAGAAELVGAAAVAAVGEDRDVDGGAAAGARLGGAGHEAGRREGAPDATVGGEALAELEQRVDVALDRERQQEDVEAVVGAHHGVFERLKICKHT